MLQMQDATTFARASASVGVRHASPSSTITLPGSPTTMRVHFDGASTHAVLPLRDRATVAARSSTREARDLLAEANDIEHGPPKPPKPIDRNELARVLCLLVARVAACVCLMSLGVAVLDRVTRDPRELSWTSPSGHEVRVTPRAGETWRFTSAGPVRVEGEELARAARLQGDPKRALDLNDAALAREDVLRRALEQVLEQAEREERPR